MIFGDDSASNKNCRIREIWASHSSEYSRFGIFGRSSSVDLWVDFYVSEEHATSIFRIDDFSWFDITVWTLWRTKTLAYFPNVMIQWFDLFYIREILGPNLGMGSSEKKITILFRMSKET